MGVISVGALPELPSPGKCALRPDLSGMTIVLNRMSHISDSIISCHIGNRETTIQFHPPLSKEKLTKLKNGISRLQDGETIEVKIT